MEIFCDVTLTRKVLLAYPVEWCCHAATLRNLYYDFGAVGNEFNH